MTTARLIHKTLIPVQRPVPVLLAELLWSEWTPAHDFRLTCYFLKNLALVM